MTKEEYKSAYLAIEDKARKELKKLDELYVNENNPYRVGDIVEDHIGRARILGWNPDGFRFNKYETPDTVYICENLNKNGSVSVREPRRRVYLSNIKS